MWQLISQAFSLRWGGPISRRYLLVHKKIHMIYMGRKGGDSTPNQLASTPSFRGNEFLRMKRMYVPSFYVLRAVAMCTRLPDLLNACCSPYLSTSTWCAFVSLSSYFFFSHVGTLARRRYLICNNTVGASLGATGRQRRTHHAIGLRRVSTFSPIILSRTRCSLTSRKSNVRSSRCNKRYGGVLELCCTGYPSHVYDAQRSRKKYPLDVDHLSVAVF